MKTAFIINGFNIHRTAADPAFNPLIAGLEQKGWQVVPVDISWRLKTVTKFAEEFSEMYEKHATEHNTVIGNSFGAVVALVTASKLCPNELYLCSLSPYFKEDQYRLPRDVAIKRFGKRRAEDLWGRSFNEVAKGIGSNIKVVITYGEKETIMYPVLVERNKIAASVIPNAQLHVLSNAPHSIRDPVYTDELLKLF